VSSESLLEAKSYTDGSWHRLHPLTPVLRAGLAVLAVIGVVFAIFWETFLDSLAHYVIFGELPENPQSDLPDIPLVGSLGGAAALAIGVLVGGALWLWLSWFVHRVRISDSLIEVVDGVVFRTHRQARRDRVNSVALWRPLIPRLFGLSKLEFQSAGSDANVTLSYLPHPIALELRRIVMQHIEKEQSGAEEATEPPATLHVEVPLERLLGSLLVSIETAWLVAVFGAIVASWLISGDPVVWVAAFPAAVFYVLTVARQWSRASQFRLESTPHTVRVSYGLLSTTSASIPPDKVHALHISQPWPWRAFKWWRVEIHRAITPGQATGNQSLSHNMVLPVGTMEDVRAVVRLFLSDSVDQEGLDALGPVLSGSLVDIECGEEPETPILRPGPWARIPLLFSYRVHSVGIIGRALWSRTGVLVRKLTIVPMQRMQSVGTFRGPFHALTHLDGLECHIVPGPGVTRMMGFSQPEARRLVDQLSKGVVESLDNSVASR